MKLTFLGEAATCLIFLFCACGGGELDEYGCRSDSDCKHGRVCVNGVCQDSGGECRSHADCPSGQHCYQGQCLVCDADSDGAFGPNCSGADCDDHNGAVHPGAEELCGDGLDNDCDGVTDPESLCQKCSGVTCPPGQACDPDTGDCVPICTPDCQDRECGPDGCGGSCGTCPQGYYCDRTGLCAFGCQDRCNRGDRACAGNAVITCEDTDGDGCVEWSVPIACPAGSQCQDGQCVGCQPDCTNKECGDDGCGGSCGECGPEMHCQNGRCVPGCQDECLWGQSQCLDQYSFRTCGEFDGDLCTDWGPRERCPEGSTCDESTGTCGGTCYDECWWGEQRCWDEFSYVQCGNWDNDPCLEFGQPVRCAPNQVCEPETGYCTGECWDECFWGESYCFDEISYIECGEWDGDPCTEFGPPFFCPDGTYCDWDLGYCTGECWDECWWDEFYCISEREYIMCGQYDNDPCSEFSEPQRCPRGTRCSEQHRGCVSDTCEDECYPGQSQCLDELTYIDCGQYDDDPCMDWGYPLPCPEGTRCDWATGYCSMPTCEPDGFEPDDSYWQAVPLDPFVGQSHSICPIGDQDWYVFRLTATTDIVLETSGSYGDSVMWLYDANRSEIDFDDDGGVDFWSRIDWRGLTAGTYYVQVAAFGNNDAIDWYTLFLTVTGTCTPDCYGRECGPDGCGGICGTCPAGEFCDTDGQCVSEGHRRGAGDPCGMYSGCPVDWSAAWTCIEYPGRLDGFCSYPCADADDCAFDFPGGCCRELVAGYSVCLPPELCSVDHPGYLEECNYNGVCLPDMFCLETPDTGERVCIFTCDTAMGVCPAGGTCIDAGDGAATGFCFPSGAGQFADPCSLTQGCQSGLLCTQVVAEHPGYCNRLCSDLMPCPYPFDCLLDDGQGGRWCAATCTSDSECSTLGDWICFVESGWGVCLPR